MNNNFEDSVQGIVDNVSSLLKIDSNTASCVNWEGFLEWAPWTGSNKCPTCGGHNIEVNTTICLTTYPAQSQLRCKDCGHYFASGIFSRNTNEDSLEGAWKHDQSILNIPKFGDAPNTPQVGDWPPYWPSEQEPPSYPDINIPGKGSTSGWVCPKCGRCWAPHVMGCSHCNESSIKITY